MGTEELSMKSVKIVSIDNDGNEEVLSEYEFNPIDGSVVAKGRLLHKDIPDMPNMGSGQAFLQALVNYYTPFGTRLRSVIEK